MTCTRRTVLLTLGVLASPMATAWSFMANNLEVTLTITDELGNAIPYPTIWAYVLSRENPLALNSEDLWRISLRYQSSFEFATPFNRIVPALMVMPMGDAKGNARILIDYEQMEGYGKQRPSAMQVGFTMMKRGYLPAKIDFSVRDEARLSGKIVLKRDPKQLPETLPYLQEFERIRYELSDTRGNENPSGFTHRRVETLRAALEGAVNQAIQNGDREAAARMYARMQYLPVIQMSGGKATGFRQTDPYSAQSRAYLSKAHELAPDNPYIAAKYLFRRGSEEFAGNKRVTTDSTPERKQAFAAYMAKLHALMRSSAALVWPEYHRLYALWHLDSLDPAERAKAKPLLEELYRFEPKLERKEQLLQRYAA